MLFEIKNLNIFFETSKGQVHAVRDISFHVKKGETLGIVGESGCGKSITNLALLGLLPPEAIVKAESLMLIDYEFSKATEKDWQKVRGKKIAMIFQDPMSALNPSITVGKQLIETLKLHFQLPQKEAITKSLQLLDQVGIPAAKSRMSSYPFELSGGMNQRIMIAMAIACGPQLLIADEPTTALDVTIQSQILDLLKNIQQEENMAMILVTHD